MNISVDTAKLPMLLTALRLPTVARLWPEFCARADKEGWPAARLLAALAELELAEREQRRIQRHLAEARLPAGKTLDGFDFTLVPSLSKAHLMALAEGDAWLKSGHNILAFGPPGTGKTHAAAGLGQELVRRGYRVLFTRTTDLVQHLQAARQGLTLAHEITRLDRFDLLILDDLSYVRKDQAETSVLFELISARYERRSIMITANQCSRTGHSVRKATSRFTRCRFGLIAFPAGVAGGGRWVVSRSRDGRRWRSCWNGVIPSARLRGFWV
jgi:DNA replication protein DnaC